MQPGSAVAVLLYENRWAAPMVTALRANGAEVVASGRIPAADVIAALDSLESMPASRNDDAPHKQRDGGPHGSDRWNGTDGRRGRDRDRRLQPGLAAAGRTLGSAGSGRRSNSRLQPAYEEPAQGEDRLEQLEKLGQLKAAGVLTEEEFQAEKSRLLRG